MLHAALIRHELVMVHMVVAAAINDCLNILYIVTSSSSIYILCCLHVVWGAELRVSMYSDSNNCPNVLHLSLVYYIASHQDQTEPTC